MKHECVDTNSLEFQGSVVRGILGSIVGMAVCIWVLLLCWLVDFQSIMLLFIGTVIGWFYRLFHGRRSKPAAYTIVGVCTMLTCLLWIPVLVSVRLSGEISHTPLEQMPAGAWSELWNRSWRFLLLCAGLGLIGLFFSRGRLLAYADWQKGPWYIAGFNASGAAYL